MKSAHTAQIPHKKQHSRSDTNGSLKVLIGNIAKGFVAEFLIGMLLLFLSAFCVYNYQDPDAIMPTLAMISLYITVICGGAITYIINKNGPMLCGVCASCLQLAAILLISQFIEEYPYPLLADGWRIILHLLCIPMGLLGVYLASRKRKPKRKKRK